MRVLIIDESATMRATMKGLLRGMSFTEIAEAGDVPTALAELQTGRFDLAVVDSRLADAEQTDLARSLHADPRLRELRTLLVAAGGVRRVAQRSPRAPRQESIARPVTAITLRMQIEALVAPLEITA